MSEQKSHIISKIAKIAGWVIVTTAFLVVLLRLSMKTTFVRNVAKTQIEKIGGSYLNGSLSIENIDGDLGNDFVLKNLSITQPDTLISIGKISVEYQFLSLFTGTINISNLEFNQINARVREENEEFNFQNLLKSTPQDTTAQGSESMFGFVIQRYTLSNSNIDISSPSFMPDSDLNISNFQATGSIKVTDTTSVILNSLEFRITEGRLPEPIMVKTSANYSDDTITLNNLILGTGESLLEAKGQYHFADSTLNARLQASPLSLKDIQPYLKTALADENVEFGLRVSGKTEQFTLDLTANGTSFEKLEITADVNLSGKPALNNLGLKGEGINLAAITENQVDADIEYFQLTADGFLSDSIPTADITWGFTFENIRYADYQVESFFGSGTLKNDHLLGNVQIQDGEDTIILYPDIKNLSSESPTWTLPATAEHLDLAGWLKNPGLKSDLSLKFMATGQGFELSNEKWEYRIIPVQEVFSNFNSSGSINPQSIPKTTITNDTISISGQRISDFVFEGFISADTVATSGYLQFIENKINFDVTASQYLGEQPEYRYELTTRKFDAREFAGFEEFPTSINLKLNGSGQYYDFEKMRQQARLKVDSSYVNGASFSELTINADLEDQILQISKGVLESDVIAGSFNGQRNLADATDPTNDIQLDLDVKNLQPLAQWIGAEVFNATGKITGNVNEITAQKLLFDGKLDLHDIVYDTVFTADAIIGNTRITMNEHYSYGFSVQVQQPTYSGFNLQDINFSASGVAIEDSLFGDFDLNIESEGAGELSQSGIYEFNTTTKNAHLLWRNFDFRTPVSLMTLQSPFNFYYADGAIRTDTLNILEPSGTFLNFAVPKADSLNQQVWLRGQDFDFGVIQEIIFNERYLDGVLSGRLRFSRSPDEFLGNGAFNISNMKYRNSELDEFNLNFKIASERLTAFINILMDGEEKLTGNLNLPFVTADPSTYDDAFYDQPVSANLKVNPVSLSEFETLLRDFDISNTQGIFSFNGNLSGTVREPNLDGNISLANPTLSGIKVDTAFAQFRYHHLEEKITASAEIHTRGQKAASINADLPISFDFIAREMSMPDESDSLQFDLITDNFNISVFNDFLDKQYMAKLRGSLNANINISGSANSLKPNGFLRLDKGQVSVPIAGITLNNINSEFGFTEQGFQLKNLSATSGSGSFNASGTIDMEGIYPTQLNLKARASRFRLANTSDYNLLVDLDGRLTGKPTRPTASGRLTVENGFIFLQDFGERSVEAVELEEEDQSSFSPYDSLAIEMQFVIADGFKVRNRRYLDMEIDMNGELEAQKRTGGELQLFGTLLADGGYVRPLGKNFTLDEGTLLFSGPIDNPDINIKTSYIPQTTQKESSPITLYYIIEGNAQDPTFRFESDPQMEQQNIICYTLFNKPCYALESWQQAISGSGGTSPTDLLVDVLLDEVEALATQQLGIDVVEIDNTRSASGSATSIKTGWYLNRRTFFAVVNEISGSTPKTLFILEYLLTQNLDLIITQGDDNRQGVDIRWQYDY